MTAPCERTLAVDIAAYLDDPSAPRWDDLRGHAASCEACGSELAAWRSLRTDLRAIDAHPSEARLLEYADARRTLSPDELHALETHFAECTSCSDEVALLESVRIEPVRERTPGRARLGPAEILAAIGRTLWHPAFAYAVVAALIVHTLTRLDRPPLGPTPSSTPERESNDVAMLRRGAEQAPAAASRADEPDRLRSLGYLGGDSSVAPAPAAEAVPQRQAEMRLSERTAMAASATSAAGRIGYVAGGRHTVSAAERANGFRISVTVAAIEESDGAAKPATTNVIPIPASERDVHIHVAASDGSRELKIRKPVPASSSGRTGLVEASIPPAWLTPGTYRVDVRTGSTGEPAAAPMVLTVAED